MYFNQRGDISKQSGSSLKLVDKFTSLWSSVSSTENDINMWLAKVLSANDRLSVIWKSDMTDKIKHFFPSSGRINTAIWMHHMNPNEAYGEKSLTATTQECCELYCTNPEERPHPKKNSSCTATYHPSRKLSKLDEPDIWGTAGKVRTNSQVMCSWGPPYLDA